MGVLPTHQVGGAESSHTHSRARGGVYVCVISECTFLILQESGQAVAHSQR